MEIPNVQTTTGLINRIKELFKNPRNFFNNVKVDGENQSKVFSGFYLPLLIISFAVSLILSILFGAIGFSSHFPRVLGFITYPIGIILTYSIVFSILTAALWVGMVFIMNIVINAFAPNFGGKQNNDNSFKVAAYSAVPGLLALMINYMPIVGILGSIAAIVFSVYFLYLGLQILMESPADKVTVYTIVVILIEVVIAFVIGLVIAAITGALILSSVFY
ncbi:MAG TPA: YIP1 family protein [Ignavibacteria bacterium]